MKQQGEATEIHIAMKQRRRVRENPVAPLATCYIKYEQKCLSYK